MALFPIVCDLKDRTNAFTIARVSVFTQASIVATSILLFVSYGLAVFPLLDSGFLVTL